ncbi:MAG: hypothetical protein ABJF10_15655 [Chthoniobacter sp.]|uniref:hypothetical protein n=1 Tax=Chthoniobacter sp. TaxID=2510640 RepID=UPI0032A3D8ED
MNPTHLHLMLNHIPVLGTAFGLGLLLFGIWRKSDEIKKTALGVFALVALLAAPAYLTGEPAEDVVKALPGVLKPVIEQYEEAATVAFVGVIVLGVAALAGLFLFRSGRVIPPWFASLILAASLIVGGLMTWTANMGGQIRHTEIRSDANPPANTGAKNHGQ